MEMVSAFTDVLHVANLNTGTHLMRAVNIAVKFSKQCVEPLIVVQSITIVWVTMLSLVTCISEL